MFKTITTSVTRCTKCGKELKSAQDFSNCQRIHSLDYWNSTAEGRQVLQGLRDSGFVDKPDNN